MSTSSVVGETTLQDSVLRLHNLIEVKAYFLHSIKKLEDTANYAGQIICFYWPFASALRRVSQASTCATESPSERRRGLYWLEKPNLSPNWMTSAHAFLPAILIISFLLPLPLLCPAPCIAPSLPPSHTAQSTLGRVNLNLHMIPLSRSLARILLKPSLGSEAFRGLHFPGQWRHLHLARLAIWSLPEDTCRTEQECQKEEEELEVANNARAEARKSARGAWCFRAM